MISFDQVSKVYGKKDNAFVALSEISLELPEHKTIAVVGKSGSGKSTLLHLLGGLDRPTSGSINIAGKELAKLSKKAMDAYRGQDLGFVFQSFFVEANQSCYQNVALPLEINKVQLSQRKAIVEDALAQVELSDKVRSKAGTLSGGQKQRLAIARAIVTKPKVILADEPTGNLDSTTGDKVIKLLFDLHKKYNATLVIVTHDQDIAAKCDVQVYIKDGRVEKVTGLKGAKS